MNELGRVWKEAVVPNLRCYPSICLGILKKITKIYVSIDSIQAKS
jgi:hypothetical protein